jgi:hypothetical protein
VKTNSSASQKGMAGTAVSLETLLDEMADRSALSKLSHPAYVAKAATSYDRASVVNNPMDGLHVQREGRDWGKGWFANRDFGFYLREEETGGRIEKVLMEDNGPGALVRWWIPSIESGMVRVYLDGCNDPVLEMPPNDLIGGCGWVGPPYSFLTSDEQTEPNWRGRNLYLPIPYQNGCKVTIESDTEPLYYQINYRCYAKDTRIRTFSMEQWEAAAPTAVAVAAQLMDPAGGITGVPLAADPQPLPPEASIQLSPRGPGAITRLLLRMKADDFQQALRSTVVTLCFDGERTGVIPIGDLCGVGYSRERNDTFFTKVDPDSGTLESYYVMPFQTSATITVTNHGLQDVVLEQFELVVDAYAWDDNSLHFYATWFEQRNIDTFRRRDLNFVTVQGAGRYVGTSITVFNTDPRPGDGTWWGEGDEKVHVDGEAFPSIFGTGTEDYFNYAWCRPQRFFNPFGSQPRGEGNKQSGYSNNNRHHLLDAIPFCASLSFNLEVWHPFREPMNYAAATFFYARPGATHNREPDVDAMRHKVALCRSDVVSVTGEPHQNPLQVYIVAGQSNAVGTNSINDLRADEDGRREALLTQPDVLFWDAGQMDEQDTKAWGSLCVKPSGAFGPEIGFASRMKSLRPRQPMAIVKCAVGGTGIARSADYNDYVPELTGFDDHGKNWHPPTEEADAGVLYQRLIKTTCNGLIALENDHINWEIAGFIWVQGEHEAGISPSMASDYGMLLQRFIGAVREDFSCSGLPVLIAGLNSHSWSFADPVRQGQKALCDNDSHAVLVDTTDISRYGSGGAAHFDATGMLTLGERFADHFVRTTTSK